MLKLMSRVFMEANEDSDMIDLLTDSDDDIIDLLDANEQEKVAQEVHLFTND